jgi:hypothetical protein
MLHVVRVPPQAEDVVGANVERYEPDRILDFT